VARTEDRRCSYRVLVGSPEEWKHLEDRGVDGSMILKWVLKNWDGVVDWIGLAQKWGWVAGCCECGSDPSGSVKCGEFLD
jgi:hypothetical protein